MGTVLVHFAIWLVFAVFWYITALAHYDFEPNPPNKTCVTGGTDFVNIFLASVEAQVKSTFVSSVVANFSLKQMLECGSFFTLKRRNMIM